MAEIKNIFLHKELEAFPGNMSYKYTVIADYPIAFYQSNGISNSLPVATYQEVLDTFATYQLFEDAFLNYEQVVGRAIEDYSGCNNTSGYLGTMESSNLPLVYGEQHAIKIDTDNFINYTILKGYDRQDNKVPFGTADTSDHDFSLECWVYPNIETTDIIPIIGDGSNNVGLFYDNGNIVFKLGSTRLDYTIPYLQKAMHLVATYNQSSASIYINGILEETVSLTDFLFTNTSLALTSGPTNNASDYLLINSIAVYRYALSLSQINSHYIAGLSISPNNITTPDQGELFKFYDNAISTQYSYIMPRNKNWQDFITDDLYYNELEDSIKIKQGYGDPKTVELNHFIMIPSGPDMDDSRIEWSGDNGVTIESSIDGITYVSCTNGEAIPQYRLGTGNFDASRDLYLKITMSTSDDSKYLPKLYNVNISFYNNHVLYAQNSGSYFSKLESLSGVTVKDVNLSDNYYPILSKDYRNGARTISGSGFYINTENLISTIEFFYTPYALTASGLISSGAGTGYSASNLSWNGSGVLSKTNIAGIYVNGVSKGSETNVSNVFNLGELHHVVLVFTSPVSGAIKMNHSSSGAIKALYQNLALYESSFNQSKVTEHYNLYIGAEPNTITDSLVTLTENSFTSYNNDWLVYQTV